MLSRLIPTNLARSWVLPAFLSLSLLGVPVTVTALEPQAKPSADSSSKRAHQFTLDNGLQVVVIPDHRAPVVTHMVWYRVGAADEPAGTSGIAHFLEHLMFKGTDKIPAGDFSKIIARNGGQDNAFTSQDATAYHQRVAKDRLKLVMEMEADRMRNLRLSEKDVLTERDVILEERRSRVDNDPSSILSEQMMAALYLSHPYGTPVIGWEHEMAKLSRQDALDFYKHFYAPNNAILVVAGDVTPEQVEKLALETYGKVEREDSVSLSERPMEPRPVAPRRISLVDERVGEATFNRLYTAPSYKTAEPGEAEALDLMMKILAGGSTSRLYNELVVDENICSQVGGWYSSSGRDYGRLGFYAVAAGKHTLEQIETEVEKVVNKFITEGATQQELDRAKNGYLAEFVYGVDSQSQMARRYGWALVVGQNVSDVDEWPQRIEKVTLEDIQKVARKYLIEKRSVTGLLIPKAKTKKAARNDAASDKDKKS